MSYVINVIFEELRGTIIVDPSIKLQRPLLLTDAFTKVAPPQNKPSNDDDEIQ
jgi:hypothetical protein